MLTLLLFLVLVWFLTGAGCMIWSWLGLSGRATFLERNLIGYGIGLGLLGYGMLVLGLLHGFRGVFPGMLVLLIGVLSFGQWRWMLQGTQEVWSRRTPVPPWGWGIALIFVFFAVVSLIGDFAPPTTGLEFDSLAYHLADPKIYLQNHGIVYLPWESHSNFGFTAEMWYTLALLLHSIPLAKLFHFSCGVGTCLAIYAFACQHLTPRIGVWAALIFASTPIVFWEAGTAYVDLATTFFATVTLLAVANGVADRENSAPWLKVGAVVMGLTLSTKATALTMLVLFALGLLYWQWQRCNQPFGKSIGMAALWGICSVVCGCPWLIKSWVWTGNPVYPFYYKIFGGRGFSAADAAQYDNHNHLFGMGHHLIDALVVPWNLTMYLLPGHPTLYQLPFNDQQLPTGAFNPVWLAVLFFPAFGLRATPIIRALGLFALATLAFWFATMQYNRYLLPLLPVLSLLASWVLSEAITSRWRAGYALAGLTGLSVAFSLLLGLQLMATQGPVVLGTQSRDAYLTGRQTGYPGYPAMQFLNALPGSVKVVLYGHPLGFYCNKPYFWGDANHSTYIPYDRLTTPEALRGYLISQGVTHMFIDASGLGPTPGYAQTVYALAAQSGPPVYTDRRISIYALTK